MNLKEIYQPVSKELYQVQIELKSYIDFFSKDYLFVKEIMNYFWKVKGKYLRPALVLLSNKSNNGTTVSNSALLIRLASVVELIHNASLIHDDIIDNDSERRGQISLNKKFGTKIALLTGDMVYANAFSILANKFDKKILKILSQCVERMCRGETNELKNSVSSFKEYLKLIGDKTATFMSACCECGAILSGSDTKIRVSLKDFGFNFGIAYQLMDDFSDGDSIKFNKENLIKNAKEYIGFAKENIAVLNNSEYKNSLQTLSDFVINNKNE